MRDSTSRLFQVKWLCGNVWEWCDDVAYTSLRRNRGGSWYHNAERCAVGHRISFSPDDRDSDFGFRVARSSGN